jgi:hypothetical protein
MQEWVKLCDCIIAAEFPDFELIHAFWVFNVVTGSRTKTGHGYFDDDPELVAACATERAAVFARLATAFGVDEVALTERAVQQVFANCSASSDALWLFQRGGLEVCSIWRGPTHENEQSFECASALLGFRDFHKWCGTHIFHNAGCIGPPQAS